MRIDSIVCWLLFGCSIAVAGPSVMRGTPPLQTASSSRFDASASPVEGASFFGESPRNAYLTAGNRELPTVTYCDLMKDQKRHRGTPVRLKANWQFGFEVSSLYDPGCFDQPKAWLELADDKITCQETKTNVKVPRESDKEAEVTVTGTLHGPGRYGHLGAYEFKFVVTCLEKIKVKPPEVK